MAGSAPASNLTHYGRAAARTATQLGRSLARRAVYGTPLTPAPLGSATLDADDVALARAWLERPASAWEECAEIDAYQSEFARWNGSAHAFSFMGGRVALSAIIHALRLGPGDAVIVPGYTCVVVPNAFHYAGVDVQYADIELETYGLDVASLAEHVTPQTKAILIQHLYGLVARDYEAVLEFARARGLYVIEDCAHATGAEYRGLKVGNRGHAAFYSSEQSKVFTTIEGGIAVTNDAAIAARLREYWEQAPFPDADRTRRVLESVRVNYLRFKHPRRWWVGTWAQASSTCPPVITTTREEERGVRPAHYGARMPAPLAALGRNQLAKIDRYNARRREVARRWEEWSLDHGYGTPRVIEGSVPVFLRYPILVEPERKRSPGWMARELHVQPGVWFTSHVHPVAIPVSGCPKAAIAVERCVNLACLP